VTLSTYRNLLPIQHCHDSCKAFGMLVGHLPDMSHMMHFNVVFRIADATCPS
jgi:hypothetical protein